jgi:hypothetical protein
MNDSSKTWASELLSGADIQFPEMRGEGHPESPPFPKEDLIAYCEAQLAVWNIHREELLRRFSTGSEKPFVLE